MRVVNGFGKGLVFGQFMNLLIWKGGLKGSFRGEFGANVGEGLGVITGNGFFMVGGELSVKGVDEAPVFEEFLFGDFSHIKGDDDFVEGECVLEEFEVEAVVVLIFGVQVEPIDVYGSRKIMVHDFAVDDAITKIFDFHFGVGVGHDLLDPVEDRGLGRHRTGSTGFLDHKKSWIINFL